MDLHDTIAIITGAAGGIGREIVRALLASGARVLAVDQAAERLDAMAGEWGEAVRLRTLALDLGAPGSAGAVVRRAVQEFGGINTLICNAGIGRSTYTPDVLSAPPRTWEVPAQAWDRLFAVNALAGIHLVNAAIPLLLAQPRARIVAVTTSLDSMLNAGTGPYGPSKAALEAFVSVVSDELRSTCVTVNVLVPGGVVNTGMIPQMEGLDRAHLLQPSVMVAPLRYLLSAQADAVTARRLRANLWDADALPQVALAAASAPIAWTSIATGQRRNPQPALR